MDVNELKEILECMSIQIEKAKKSLDGVDNNLTEAYKAIDAIQYDWQTLKDRIK